MSNLRTLLLSPRSDPGNRLEEYLRKRLLGLGTEVITIERDFTLGNSWADPIFEAIRKADLIFCDISLDSINLYYELGIAHAMSKPTVLLRSKQSRIEIPQALQGFLYYAFSPDWPEADLHNIVARAVEEAIKKKEGINE
ncbi:MAG: response regulator [Thermodesulfobacteriota bacterium]|nr:response regulator [Thermodesulfobacteriota bacterium]